MCPIKGYLPIGSKKYFKMCLCIIKTNVNELVNWSNQMVRYN